VGRAAGAAAGALGGAIGAAAGRIGGIAPGGAVDGRIAAGGVGIGTRAMPPCCINSGRLYTFIMSPMLRPQERLIRQCRSLSLVQVRFAVVM
jgi:hypothetical protein